MMCVADRPRSIYGQMPLLYIGPIITNSPCCMAETARGVLVQMLCRLGFSSASFWKAASVSYCASLRGLPVAKAAAVTTRLMPLVLLSEGTATLPLYLGSQKASQEVGAVL